MIIIRADGNEYIGLGHMMRCLSFADALKAIGEDVLFVTADHKCGELLTKRGFSHGVLDSDFSDLENETDRLIGLIDRYRPYAVLIDSYYVTDRYLRALRGKTKVVYIDDQLSFAYPVDLLINYNIFSRRDDYERLYQNAEIAPALILGTEYTPLRSEFSGVTSCEQPDFAGNVLISTGGADPQHIALQLIRYIKEHSERFERFVFSFVIGAANRDIDEIREIAESIQQIRIVHNARNMSKLMLDHDMAVSAAGSTLYELCACGVPTITYVLADNQIPAAVVFGDKGIMIDAGDVRKNPDFIRDLFDRIMDLAENKEKRIAMSQAMRTIVDGRGANRLATVISQLKEDNDVSI